VIRELDKPPGFDDLEDEDHDGNWLCSFDDDDDDDALDASFFIDEPGT